MSEIEIEASQVRVGDHIVRERHGSTFGEVRNIAYPSPGDPSVGLYVGDRIGPRWFEPDELVRVTRPEGATQ